jgi:chromosome partitioning protein
MRKLGWIAEKGGVGKTTCCINSAVGLAKLGRRVLVVDLDPQSNASLVLLEGKPAEGPTVTGVMMGEAAAADAVRSTRTPGLDLLPADVALSEVNIALATRIGRERRLRAALADLEGEYDFVVVDTNPTRSLLTINALNFVEEVLVPIEPSLFALAGLGQLQTAIDEVAQYLDNKALRLAGLLLSRTRNDNTTRDVESQLREAFAGLVFQATIPTSAPVESAHSRYQSVLDFAPRSAGAVAFSKLVKEIDSHGSGTKVRDGKPAGRADSTDDAA